jgi:hypothetical protein
MEASIPRGRLTYLSFGRFQNSLLSTVSPTSPRPIPLDGDVSSERRRRCHQSLGCLSLPVTFLCDTAGLELAT